MKLKTVKLARLSICPCGYPVLLDSISVGTEYLIDPAAFSGGFVYRCGGCGREQRDVPVVFANRPSRPSDDLRPIPAGLFDL